jgi:hypothetical protein
VIDRCLLRLGEPRPVFLNPHLRDRVGFFGFDFTTTGLKLARSAPLSTGRGGAT